MQVTGAEVAVMRPSAGSIAPGQRLVEGADGLARQRHVARFARQVLGLVRTDATRRFKVEIARARLGISPALIADRGATMKARATS